VQFSSDPSLISRTTTERSFIPRSLSSYVIRLCPIIWPGFSSSSVYSPEPSFDQSSACSLIPSAFPNADPSTVPSLEPRLISTDTNVEPSSWIKGLSSASSRHFNITASSVLPCTLKFSNQSILTVAYDPILESSIKGFCYYFDFSLIP
jgi:hypothetical protein